MSSEKKSGGCGKWLGGCGCIVVVMVVGVIALASVFGPGLTDTLKEGFEQITKFPTDNPVYVEAMARAKAHPWVQERLGTPIEHGQTKSFSISKDMTSTNVVLKVEISGPKGTGNLDIDGRYSGDEAAFEDLKVWIGSEGLNLLENPAETPPTK